MLHIDMNCDMGESFGVYRLGRDAEVLPYVTSVNIACGFHAGDPSVMRETVRKALEAGVSVGAHPGLPDLAGFGRRVMNVTPSEVYDMVSYQIGALEGILRQEGGQLSHVKPHGALYNMAAVSAPLAGAITAAVRAFNPRLILYGLSGSELIYASREAGLHVAEEVFADRTYQNDGTLTPRSRPDALITDAGTAVRQVLRMVREGKVTTAGKQDIHIRANTVCIHGDGASAPEFARSLRSGLEQEGITVQSLAPLSDPI